jgi:hypothetical protein
METRNIPLAILIPADETMCAFYNKFNYEQVFEANDIAVPLAKIVDENKDFCKAYEAFEGIYRQQDFCIQKTFADFQTIISDWECAHRPTKTNVAAMARLINPDLLFDLYKQKTGHHFTVNLSDEMGVFSFSGNVLNIHHRLLCRLLFGYKTSEFPSEITRLFPEHQPVLNLMLE